MAALDHGKPFGFERTFISLERKVGDGDVIMRRHDHQKRSRRDAFDEVSRRIHPRPTCRANGHLVVPDTFGNRLKIEADGVRRIVGGRFSGIVADDRLDRRRFASELRTLIGCEPSLESRDGFRRDASQAIGIAVDRGDLGDYRFDASVGCAENDGVTARVARAPETNAILVHLRPLLEPGNRAPPIADLLPGVDVMSRFAAAATEIAVIMQQHDKSGIREGLGEGFEAMVFRAGKTVGHSNGRPRSSLTVRHK